MARLSRIVLLLRDLDHGIRFYRDGLGLLVDAQTRNYARLRTTNNTAVELCTAERYVIIPRHECKSHSN